MNLVVALVLFALGGPTAEWPAFRGVGDSVARGPDLPLEWSEAGIAWRLSLPGYGQSSPVVAGGRAFVTSVEGEFKDILLVNAVDVVTGKILWTKRFPGSQRVQDSDYVSKGAPTPVVDAERVYAFFESGDLIALDHDGQEVWKRSLVREYGEFKGNHGIGASPALAEDAIILLLDHDGPSYLLAVDRKTGENRWKIDRPARVSWTSPTVARWGDREVIYLSSSGTAEAVAAEDGKRIWLVEGLDKNTVCSPSLGKDLVVMGASEPNASVAIRLGGEGNVTASHVAWRAESASNSFASPLVHAGHVYFVNKAGVAFCLDEATGAPRWNARLSGSCWASPIGAGKRVYFFGKDGTTTVVGTAPTLEKLAENKLPTDDRVYGVAVIENGFLVRAGRELIRIGKPEK